MFGGVTEEMEESNTMYIYEVEKDSWSKVEDKESFLPKKRSGASMAQLNGNLFMFGGLNQEVGWLGDVWKFNLKENQWTEIKSEGEVPSARDKATMCSTSEKIYLFGGFQPKQKSGTTSSQPESLPVVREEEDEWDDVSEEDEVANTQVAMEFEWSSELFEFDGKTWKLVKTGGITPRAAHSMVAVKSSSEEGVTLYVFGGRGEKERQNDIWKFENGEWEQLKARGCAPDPCSYSKLVYVGNERLVAFGGLNQDNKHSDSLHMLDLPSRTWLLPEVCSDLQPNGVSNHSMELVGEDQIVLVGGSYDFQLGSCQKFSSTTWKLQAKSLTVGGAIKEEKLEED